MYLKQFICNCVLVDLHMELLQYIILKYISLAYCDAETTPLIFQIGHELKMRLDLGVLPTDLPILFSFPDTV